MNNDRLSVGRGLGSITTLTIDTPPISPNSNGTSSSVESTIAHLENHRYERKTSTGSSPSRASSDEDSRHSNTMMNSVTYIGGVTTRSQLPIMARSSSINLSSGSSFRMKFKPGNQCPRCLKNVYSAEEVKAAGKVNCFLIFFCSIFIRDSIRI